MAMTTKHQVKVVRVRAKLTQANTIKRMERDGWELDDTERTMTGATILRFRRDVEATDRRREVSSDTHAATEAALWNADHVPASNEYKLKHYGTTEQPRNAAHARILAAKSHEFVGDPRTEMCRECGGAFAWHE